MHSFLLAACCLIGGTVHTPAGAPIAQAHVVLVSPTGRTEMTTDAHGEFAAQSAPGAYDLGIAAAGFVGVSVSLLADRDLHLDVALEPTDSPQFRVIARVTVNGATAVVRSAIPAVDLSRADYERSGFDRVIEGLAQIPSVTFARPDGGNGAAPAVVALRGPDPSETLIALDGQLLNDGNTGDLDLSQFPIAAFSAISLTEGLGPSDSEGSNTIGGAIDLLSLRPTIAPHSAFSLSTGSYGSNAGWYNATGSHGKFGYAFALSDRQDRGIVDELADVCAPGDSTSCTTTHLGSTVSSRAALVNLGWNFSDRSDVGFRVLTLANTRDLSSSLDGIDGVPDPGNPDSTYGMLIGPGNAVFGQIIRAYQFHARTPAGAGSLKAEYAVSNNSVDLTGNDTGVGSSPYDISHQDRRQTGSLSWSRSFDRSEYELGGYVRRETMVETGVDDLQAQNISSYFVRGSVRASERLRLSGGVYASHYTTFGSNLDGRIAASYDVDSATALRFSVGTGFRAPLLIERVVFPDSALPPPDANCVITGQGNPDEKPEHATEYELGYSHTFASQANLDVSLYRTNLRDPIENFYPLGTANPGCGTVYYSIPINVGNVVYQGAEVRFRQNFPKQHLAMNLQYGLNVAYPTNFGATISNPTSGGNLVNNAQFLGIPQQMGSIGLAWDQNDWHGAIDTTFRGYNNELNRGPFAMMTAEVGKRFAGGLDISLAGTNLLNNASGRYTVFGAGAPYRGLVGFDPSGDPIYGPLPTDRLAVEPFGVRLVVTIRH